ncbi:MAG: heme NO-binding domain-containing protein [Mariniblastus sp.]
MNELKKFTVENHGEATWRAVLEMAGIPLKIYLPIAVYDDSEAVGIATAAAELLGVAVSDVLFEFGKFTAPNLITMYKTTIDPSWKTEQLLLNTEGTIHKAVRIQKADARPPKLKFKSLGPGRLHFHYDSERRMPAVARGIMTGVADHFKEQIHFVESENEDGSVDFDIKIG